MRLKIALLLSLVSTLASLALGVSTASAHQCWSWCDVRYFSNGGLITCGSDHDGQMFSDPYGGGYLCEHYFGGGHVHFYFVSGF